MSSRVHRPRPVALVVTALLALAGSALPGPGAVAMGQGTVPKQLLVTLHVTDKKGVPFTDVTAEELQVKENGKSHPVQQAVLDVRPLAVALILDNNSQMSTSFMQSVVPAGIAVVKALPPATTMDIWTTGDRPTRVATAVTDAAAVDALKSLAATGTNALLNTIAEASKALPTDEAHRTAVIVMSSGTLGDSGGYGFEQALKVTSMRPTYVSLEFVQGQADSRVENELEYLAVHTAGFFERVLSITALEKRAPQLVALINAQYRVTWLPSGDPQSTKFEFTTSRKGAKVVAAERMSAVW